MFCQNCLINIYHHIKYIIRYYVCTKRCYSIKLSLKYLNMVVLDFCITYLKKTKSNPVTYLTATKIFKHIQLTAALIIETVTQYTLVLHLYFSSSTITKLFTIQLW